MRKYYMFLIKENIYNSNINKPYYLYNTLKIIKDSNVKDIKSNIKLYNEICEPFNLDRIYNYFTKKYKVKKRKHYYFINHKKEETYLVEINHSCLIILSNSNYPTILKMLSYYSKYIFVCDFINGDYFYLDSIFTK